VSTDAANFLVTLVFVSLLVDEAEEMELVVPANSAEQKLAVQYEVHTLSR